MFLTYVKVPATWNALTFNKAESGARGLGSLSPAGEPQFES
jgi:hypothetical protein